MQVRVLDDFRMQWLKRAEPNMQRDVSNVRSGSAAAFDDGWRKVQARSGGGDRTCGGGEHGLIAVAIVGSVVTSDIGRQRNVTDAVEHVVHIALPFKLNRTFAKLP